MPRAFLIRSRSAFPTQNSKKENLPEVQDENNRNAQSTGISEHFKQDFSSVAYAIPTTSVDHITPADDDVDRRVYAGHMRELERSNSEDEKQGFSRSSLEIPKYRVINTKINQGGRKKSKRALETQPGDLTDNYVPKKVRKGQPKKTVVYYYETAEETQARENNGFHKVPKDESGCGRNYTHDKRHYANEHSRYHNHEASQSPGTSSDNFYSSSGGKQTGSFAMQNSRESLDQEKAASKGTQKNNDVLDKNAGLENVMIVEYHSMSRNQDKRYRANEHKSTEPVTQQTSRGYYLPSRSVHTTSYRPVTTNVTTSVPAKIQPPQSASVPAVKQESETKVVYVPVFPVSRGPNGVIYEAIPNATPIMAKDTVQVQPSQPEPQQAQQPPRLEPPRAIPQQPHRPEPPRAIPQQQIVQPGQEVIVRPVMPSPPAPQNEPRMEYRAYEPHMPQQLTATPAPGHQSFQPHHQGHVMVQQQTAPPYPSHTTTVVQVPQYQASRPHYKQQYQPRAEHPQTSHAATVPQPHNYRPKHQTVSASQPPNTRGSEPVQHYQHARPAVPVSQTYHEVPVHQYTAQQSQLQHHNYQREEITVQRYPSPVNVVVSAPQNMYPDRVAQPRPPPLPSQPQHVEKPALPSPSYPQESANRQLTPRYTPDGVNHRHKFVYAPPPADFMNSPVYRVPKNEEKSRNEAYYNGKVGNKSGSKKRKSSLPSHAVMPRKIDEHQEIPSPVESNSRTPSPKETDLRCNERLVKSPNRPSTLNKSSLVITPPVSPTEGEEENIETVTVVVRDQGIQASPKDGRSLEHTCYKRPIKHMRSGSYHSESSEEEFLEDDNCNMKDTRKMKAEHHLRSQSDEEEDEDHGTYTADGTLVVRIPYSETNNLKKQHRAKRGNYRFVCRYCNKGFQWHSHLESHERTHTGEKPFKCPECDRAFCRADGLQCHMLVHNKKRPYKCPYCGKGFNDKIILEKHIYSHTGVKPFKCEYCGRAFSDSLSIEKHLLVHTGSKPYKCPYCVRSFNDSQMLVRHIRSHTGEKPFKCKHCPMAFSKQSALIIHTRVHTGEKPYQCPHCIKSFSISGNLQRHILIHTGERPYKCSKCPKAFNNPSHLSRHISKLHAPQLENAKEQIKYEQFQPEQPYHSPPEVV